MITQRHCALCRAEMQCQRASKKLCSNRCQAYFHRKRQKLGLSIQEMFALLEKENVTLETTPQDS